MVKWWFVIRNTKEKKEQQHLTRNISVALTSMWGSGHKLGADGESPGPQQAGLDHMAPLGIMLFWSFRLLHKNKPKIAAWGRGRNCL